MIGHPHGQAIVESEAPLAGGQCQPGQTADVLGDGDRSRLQLVNQAVGQGQVGQGVFIQAVVEIVFIGTEHPLQAVVTVEHAGDPVKAKPVQAILVQPETAVGEQKPQDTDLAVVEAARTPGRVPAGRPGVKILAVRAVETAEPLHVIGRGMGVNQIHDHRKAQLMGRIDQVLERFGGAEARGNRKEAGDLVAERGVIGVLLDGHQLQGVVAGGSHPRQDRVRKLPE